MESERQNKRKQKKNRFVVKENRVIAREEEGEGAKQVKDIKRYKSPVRK